MGVVLHFLKTTIRISITHKNLHVNIQFINKTFVLVAHNSTFIVAARPIY